MRRWSWMSLRRRRCGVRDDEKMELDIKDKKELDIRRRWIWI